MQIITLLAHAAGCIVALYIHWKHREWKYYAAMLLMFNGVGVLFYLTVLFESPLRHDFSQVRSLIQALILLMFSVGLIRTLGGGNHA